MAHGGSLEGRPRPRASPRALRASPRPLSASRRGPLLLHAGSAARAEQNDEGAGSAAERGPHKAPVRRPRSRRRPAGGGADPAGARGSASLKGRPLRRPSPRPGRGPAATKAPERGPSAKSPRSPPPPSLPRAPAGACPRAPRTRARARRPPGPSFPSSFRPVPQPPPLLRLLPSPRRRRRAPRSDNECAAADPHRRRGLSTPPARSASPRPPANHAREAGRPRGRRPMGKASGSSRGRVRRHRGWQRGERRAAARGRCRASRGRGGVAAAVGREVGIEPRLGGRTAPGRTLRSDGAQPRGFPVS